MPRKRSEVYSCAVCGNMVEILRGKSGMLVCCGKPMELLEADSVDAATEKHVPVIVENEGGGILVKVGEVPHPMAEDHYIEWIEIIRGELVSRVYLSPGDAPEAKFCGSAEGTTARAFCNLHGLWKSA